MPYIMRDQFLKNAVLIAVGGFIAKLIGAVYRIPLLSLLGARGMGLYQMAYPFFALVLTLSTSGVPSYFAHKIASLTKKGGFPRAEGERALLSMGLVGLLGTVVLSLSAPVLAEVQGERELSACILALAPSVFPVCLIAVLRGYYQGLGNMLPTASSEIVEQTGKACGGVVFISLFGRIRGGSECALFAVTVSEYLALALLLVPFLTSPKRRELAPKITRPLIVEALPAIVSTAVLPLSTAVDSVLAVHLMGTNASAEYGLLTGGALSLVAVPVGVCYGLAVSVVPLVSASQNKREKAIKALAYTMALASVFSLALFALAPLAIRILFSALESGERALLLRLVRLSAVSVLSLSSVQTLSACLTGMGRAKTSALCTLVAVAVKFVLELFLLPRYGVEGMAICLDVCYLIAFYLQLWYTVRERKGDKAYDHDNRTWRRGRGRVPKSKTGDLVGGARRRAVGTYAVRGNAQRMGR